MAQAVRLYRRIAREIPRLVTVYDLPHTPRQIRAGVANRFRCFADINDAQVVNLLVSKAEMELEESLMQWKQKTHVVRLIDSFASPGTGNSQDWPTEGRGFLQNFHFGSGASGTGELLFSTFWAAAEE